MNQALSMDQVFLNKVTAIIEANLANENFGAEDLSRELGMSHSNVNRKLKSIQKKTISQFIQEIRLQRAMDMLKNKVGTAAEIAYQVGFNSPTYFNKCFHDYYGFPPGEVKKLEEYDREKDIQRLTPKSATIREKIFSQKSKKWFLLSFTLILCVVGAIAAIKIIQGGRQAEDMSGPEKSIAILPFINDSPDEENAYFINGIMDEILMNLQKIKDFRVLSRTSVEHYRGATNPPIPKIAEDLGVNYIVEGSGQKYGNRCILRVQLIAAGTEKHLWGESYDQEIREPKDIIDLQSRIAQAIALELQATLSPQERRLIENSPTNDLMAYDLYQRGEEEMRKYTVEGSRAFKRAEEFYRGALEHDTAFTWAYLGLARIYSNKRQSEDYFSESYMDSVFILTNRALSYNDQLSRGYVLLGWYYREKRNMKKAIREYDKAIRINPNLWQAYYGRSLTYDDHVHILDDLHKAESLIRGPESSFLLRHIARIYLYIGFFEKSRYYNLQALKVSGDSVAYFYGLSNIEWSLDSIKKAHEFLEKAYTLDTNNIDVLRELVSICGWMGQYEKSLEYWNKYLEESKFLGRSVEYLLSYKLGMVGYVYWNLGKRDEAEYCFNKQVEYNYMKLISGDTFQPGLFLANVYAFKGDRDKAYKYLNICNKQKYITLNAAGMLKYEPLFSSIRNEPEFQKILKDFEAKYQAEHERVRKWLEKKEML